MNENVSESRVKCMKDRHDKILTCVSGKEKLVDDCNSCLKEWEKDKKKMMMKRHKKIKIR